MINTPTSTLAQRTSAHAIEQRIFARNSSGQSVERVKASSNKHESPSLDAVHL